MNQKKKMRIKGKHENKLSPLLSSLTITSVKIIDGGHCFYFSLFTLFFFFFFFSFLFLEQTQVRVYQSHCHISHKLMA